MVLHCYTYTRMYVCMCECAYGLMLIGYGMSDDSVVVGKIKQMKLTMFVCMHFSSIAMQCAFWRK